MMSDYVKILEECSGVVTAWRPQTIKIDMMPGWVFDLSDKDRELYGLLGEQQYFRHKHIIAKAIKKHRNIFTS